MRSHYYGEGDMAAGTVSVISTTELLQTFGFLVEPLLLFAAYVALDISRLHSLSKRGLVEREAASGVFYLCSVVFLHLILLSIRDAIPAQGVFNLSWYAGVSGLIVLTAVVFRKATQVTLQLNSLVARTEVLETNRQNLSQRLNAILRALSELRMEFSHSTQLENDRLASAENRLKGLEGSYQSIVAGYEGLTVKYQNDITITNERQERYESLIQKLREQSQILLAQIEETGRLQKEYKEKIEQTPERPEKPASVGKEQREDVKLTREDGITNREKGNNAQMRTAEYLKGLGFVLQNDCDKSAPDFLLFNGGIMVGIGAHKGFTLTKSGTRQRSISPKGVDIEYETAKALHLPLILFVTNLDNGQRWAKMIPYDELGKFKSVSTPVILSENSPEAYQTLQNTINEVQKSLGYQTSG
jgi:hypothetical protein